jgi:phosphoribosylaminoimidazolecarboxamide formyltransferase/IMP cyclohydrolase
LGQGLITAGFELVSTGGSAAKLRSAGLDVTDVKQITGFPEMMNGRVKTLHPAVHAGILARQGHDGDASELHEHRLGLFEIVVVNLYPFQETVAQAGVTMDVAVEKIDIGGPTMVRAAAKNHARVTVLTSPADYEDVLLELKSEGAVTLETRTALAAKAFAHTANYDTAIAQWMQQETNSSDNLPQLLNVRAQKMSDLRYGENPHQKAALYNVDGQGWAKATIHQGKALSYNNLLDLTGAYDLVRDLTGGPAIAIIKHTNPCGAAVHQDGLVAAYNAARECDPISSFGGIVAANDIIDTDLAKVLTETFLEVVVAPGFTQDALEILRRKKNLRVVGLPLSAPDGLPQMLRRVDGGFIAQSPDSLRISLSDCEVVSERQPSSEELASLQFAWEACKHVKSNAIVFARGTALAAVGAGQMSRIDSVKLCQMKATRPLSEGTVLASDAFFPFRDGLDAAHAAGATAVVQPGGSRNDQQVIDACNEHGMAMVFTRTRHFRH